MAAQPRPAATTCVLRLALRQHELEAGVARTACARDRRRRNRNRRTGLWTSARLGSGRLTLNGDAERVKRRRAAADGAGTIVATPHGVRSNAALRHHHRRQPPEARVARCAGPALGALEARGRRARSREAATRCASRCSTRSTRASTSSPTASRRAAISSPPSSKGWTASTSSTSAPCASATATTPTCRWWWARLHGARPSTSTTPASCARRRRGR